MLICGYNLSLFNIILSMICLIVLFVGLYFVFFTTNEKTDVHSDNEEESKSTQEPPKKSDSKRNNFSKSINKGNNFSDSNEIYYKPQLPSYSPHRNVPYKLYEELQNKLELPLSVYPIEYGKLKRLNLIDDKSNNFFFRNSINNNLDFYQTSVFNQSQEYGLRKYEHPLPIIKDIFEEKKVFVPILINQDEFHEVGIRPYFLQNSFYTSLKDYVYIPMTYSEIWRYYKKYYKLGPKLNIDKLEKFFQEDRDLRIEDLLDFFEYDIMDFLGDQCEIREVEGEEYVVIKIYL